MLHPIFTFGRSAEVEKEAREHPSLPASTIRRIVADHARRNTGLGAVASLADAVQRAVAPDCHAGTSLDATGEYCLDATAPPPSPPCQAGTTLDGTGKYCIGTPSALVTAASACPTDPTPDGGSIGWAYFPEYRACFPQGFMGSDTPPDAAVCPDRAPIYDHESRLCLYPGINLDMPKPGAAPAAKPICPQGGTWTITTGHCVATPAATTNSSALPLVVGVGVAAAVGWGIYKYAR